MINYNISYKLEIKDSELPSFILGILDIQKTIGWEHPDPSDAIRRIAGSFFPKFLVKENASDDLLAYAYILLRAKDIYVCQLAVRKDKQNAGIGKALMAKIFEVARNLNILTVVLEADKCEEAKLSHFYNSLSCSKINVVKSGLTYIFDLD